MQPITTAAPFANITGIDDQSSRPPVYEAPSVPSYYPHIYFYAERGKRFPVAVIGDSFLANFGAKTLDPKSKFYTHQSELASTVMNRGTQILGQRIIPADAKTSRLLISIDLVADKVAQFERNTDGTFKRDSAGAKIPLTGSAATADGHRVKFVLNQFGGKDFGAVESGVGSLVSESSEQSTVYPLFELELESPGAWGDNIGLRLDAPTAVSAAPINDAVVKAIKANLYRFQIIQRESASASAQLYNTLGGEATLDLTFASGKANPFTTAALSVEDVLVDAYRSIGVPGTPDVPGPFERLHVYQSNLELVLKAIGELEAPYGTLGDEIVFDDSLTHLVNPFTATSLEGVPYYSVAVLGALNGGLAFGANASHWATGGADGEMDAEKFDAAVRAELVAYGTNGIDILDHARYEQSAYIDTGFKLATKMEFINLLGKRDDIHIALSTQDVSQPANTAADESAMAIALRTALRLHPESEIHGTGVCRGVVIGHAGKLLNSNFKGLSAAVLEYADKCAQYMGAADGVWKTGMGFDKSPNNQLRMFSELNVTFKSAVVRNKDWGNGLVWAQRYDKDSFFWPAVQTVYDDDTSVLNSPITMMAAVELIKVSRRVWRDLTGRSDLTDEQFIERSNRMITEKTANRFDERFVIVPETFFTEADTQRGYSWSTKINLYSNTMKTVGTYTVVARRMSDLNQSAA